MKHFSLLFFMYLSFGIHAQNLIPNGDFENNIHGQVLEWKQPLDDYYHYDVWVNQTDSGITYNSVNGLCLLQPDPSEFMIAKLKQPLVKGKRYCASMNIYYNTTFVGKVKPVQTIDIVFSDTNIQVWKRRILYREPVIRFPFMHEDGTFFQPDKIVFEAKGNEQYIIIGKFHTPEEQFTMSLADKRDLIWKELYYTNDSIKRYYFSLMPNPNPAFTKKEIKRETKRLNDSINQLDELKREALHANAQIYHQKVADLVNDKDDTTLFHQRYHVRVYFDNICIAPVLLNNECECNSEPALFFKVGQTYWSFPKNSS